MVFRTIISGLATGLHGASSAQPLGRGELLRVQQDLEKARPVDWFHDQREGKAGCMFS